jgi:hypothetical protein
MHACIQIQALHQTFKMKTNQSITQLRTPVDFVVQPKKVTSDH